MLLCSRGIQASWRQGVVTPGQDAAIGKIGHLGWPARVGLRGDLFKPSLDPRALITPLVPCSGVWLPITLDACCSPRQWSRDWAEMREKGKMGNVARTVSRITAARPEQQSATKALGRLTRGHMLQELSLLPG